jgi:hypothetical protein
MWPDDPLPPLNVPLRTAAPLIADRMDYKDEPKLFSLNANSLLYQVIDALEEFKQRTHALHHDA